MIDTQFIEQQILQWVKPIQLESHVIIPTTLVYPSRSAVMIYAEGGSEHFSLSDGGGAIAHLHEAGAFKLNGVEILKKHFRNSDWAVNNSGWIYTHKPITKKEFLSEMFELASVSVTASQLLLKKTRHHFSNFKLHLEEELNFLFKNSKRKNSLEKKGKILGASNKNHTFDFVAKTSNLTIAIDGINPDTYDINHTFVSHLDIKNSNNLNLQQMIIYDESENWRSSDLALLSMSVPPLPYRVAKEQLRQLAV